MSITLSTPTSLLASVVFLVPAIFTLRLIWRDPELFGLEVGALAVCDDERPPREGRCLPLPAVIHSFSMLDSLAILIEGSRALFVL